MAEQWIVRVEGKEYGPVEVDELREWRREGRLIATNEVRQAGTERWILASELPEVFADAAPLTPPPLVARPPDVQGARTWSQIFAETFRIYRCGFVPFMIFGLLISVPMFIGQWEMPNIRMLDLLSENPDPGTVPALPRISIVMMLLVVLVWPISTAGVQIVADQILQGKKSSFSDQFSAATRCWGRVLGAGFLVYGSYFFWIFVPLTAMLAPLNTGNLFLAVFVITVVGTFMVYRNARLFINFLFWQQTTVIEQQPPTMALIESKELARSIPEAPPLDRPLYRGAIITSIWLLLLLGLTFGVHMTFMMIRILGINDVEKAMEIAKKAVQTPDALTFTASVIAASINLLLGPLLAVSFVVLYHDAKARSGRGKDDT